MDVLQAGGAVARQRKKAAASITRHPAPGLDQLVFYLHDAGAQERITARRSVR